MHFYIAFSKELIRGPQNGIGGHSGGNMQIHAPESEASNLEILRKTIKNITDENIEVFLHY